MKVCPVCNLRYQDDTARCFADDSVLEAADDPRIGTDVAGRYSVESILGQGGMATVYLARSTLVGKPVAIKIMHEHFADDPTLRERSLREAKAAASITHPNIVEIFDSGVTDDGLVYSVMEFLDGQSLREVLGLRPMPPLQVVALGLQISRGLARAHDFGLIHRDVKPENIFICHSDDGQPVVKLVDFGLALGHEDTRLTATGQIVGSPQYMAPERFDSRSQVGVASDLYSLGVVLFEMLTGRLPFESTNVAGFILAHLEEIAPRVSTVVPKCPPDLDAMIAELLAKSPDERPVDAHQVISRLEALAPARARRVRHVSRTSSETLFTVPEGEDLPQWVQRGGTFQAMVDRLWPTSSPPRAVEEALGELMATVGRLSKLRKIGLQAHTRLEAAEVERRQSRERLGHAVDTIANDLSDVRTRVRTSQVMDLGAHAMAGDTYRKAFDRLAELNAKHEFAPNESVMDAMRSAMAAYGEWMIEHTKSGETDLEYQLEELQKQLESVEARGEHDEAGVRQLLEKNGKERRNLEMRLLQLAGRLTEQLRPHTEVRDLFDEMGRKASAASGGRA